MASGDSVNTSATESDAQSQPVRPADSTSDSQGTSHHAKTVTSAPVPKTYIRMPKRSFPPNPMPENYVRLDQITDELYDKFCKEVLHDEKQPGTKQERKLLDNMSASGDFGAAVDFYDEILGELPVVMVHMRTSKVFLSPNMRDKCIEKVIAVKKNSANPICSSLAHIQQLFVGFPPEIRLRHLLVAELERQLPGTLSEEDKRLLALPPSARFTARPGSQVRRSTTKDDPSSQDTPRRSSSRAIKPKERTTVDSKGDIVTINASQPSTASAKLPPKPKPMFLNLLVPLDDNIYDQIAEVLADRRSLESVDDEPLRLAIENVRDSGEVMVEDWLEEQFFCPPGLRLRTNDDVGRIYLRKSEVAEVWRMCYATLSERPQCEILNAVDAQYVGIATKAHIREVSKYDLLKGARVVFPAPPRSIGRKPMQYVQIDIIAMEGTMYGERSYSQALFLTDLYSGYCFARALTDSPDLAIIVRHVMDIFGSFGPPEVYRTFSVEYASVISDVMQDIERLFKIPIKNMGVGGNLTRDLLRALYRRAETELLATNRWVEALPFAVIEQNQQPSRFLDTERTPFEIMFNRHAWRDEMCPPWVNPPASEDDIEQSRSKSAKKGKRRYMDNGDNEYDRTLDSVKDLKQYAYSLVESRKKIRTQALPVYVPIYNEEGKLVNPGTGFLYHVFDRVYVRNPNYSCDGRSSKHRTHVARYYRGIIVDIDVDLVDSMYKVLYWEDDPHDIDAMSETQWPAADDTYDCASSWFGPWDVTASTAHLAKLRTVPAEYCGELASVKRRTIDFRCRCDSPACTGFAHFRCQRKFSTECCLKSPYDCSFHKRGDRYVAEAAPATFVSSSQPAAQFQKGKFAEGSATSASFDVKADVFAAETPHAVQSHKRARCSINAAPPLAEKRYTFRDGILVEISSANEADTPAPSGRGAPPVLRRRGISEHDEGEPLLIAARALKEKLHATTRESSVIIIVVLPSVRPREAWSTLRSSMERADSAATMSDDGAHVQFTSPEDDSLHSGSISPTPSACYEIEIDETTESHPSDEVPCTSAEAASRVECSADRPQNQQNVGEASNGANWDAHEMSLRPRVAPRREHPYERTVKVSRPISPTAKALIENSLVKRLEKPAAPERRSYTAKTVSGSESTEGTLPPVSNGPKASYRLAAVPRSAPHVHPFDAELMAEEKSTGVHKREEGSANRKAAPQTPAGGASTTVARRVYVVKAAIPQPVEPVQRNTSE